MSKLSSMDFTTAVRSSILQASSWARLLTKQFLKFILLESDGDISPLALTIKRKKMINDCRFLDAGGLIPIYFDWHFEHAPALALDLKLISTAGWCFLFVLTAHGWMKEKSYCSDQFSQIIWVTVFKLHECVPFMTIAVNHCNRVVSISNGKSEVLDVLL